MIKTLDSTKSTESTTTTNQMLVFGCTHNGINCTLNNSAERPCDKAWFTAKQIETWSKMSKMTLNRRLNKLEEVGRINGVSDMIHCEMPTNNGGHQSVTLYNLNVLNQLAMVELDCPVLNETAKKFSDILSEVETTGSYNPSQMSYKDQLYLSVLHAESEVDRVCALKTMYDYHAQEIAVISEQRDKAVHDRYKINEGRTASVMGKLGATVRTCNNLKTENGILKTDWYSTKDTCAIIREHGLTSYSDSTLQQKTSKALKMLSAELKIPVREEILVVDNMERTKPFFFKDVVDALINRLVVNPRFLKSIK